MRTFILQTIEMFWPSFRTCYAQTHKNRLGHTFSILCVFLLQLCLAPLASWAEGSPKGEQSTLTAYFEASRIKAVSCNGGEDGEAEVTVTGGSPPYEYLWSQSIGDLTAKKLTGLKAGQYTVRVQDGAGAFVFAKVTITQPDILKADFYSSNITHVKCKGESTGSATPTVTGGTPPYQYQWSNNQTTSTITNLKAGAYNVKIFDANLCESYTSLVLIDEPEDLFEAKTFNFGKTNISCHGKNDGSCKVYPFNGTAPYTYKWNTTPAQFVDSATNLSAGSHSVEIVDASGCVATTTVSIIEPQPLTAFIDPQKVTNPKCAGYTSGIAEVSVSGGTEPYSYIWEEEVCYNPSSCDWQYTSPVQTTHTAIQLAARPHRVTVTDKRNCTTTATITITSPPELKATIDPAETEHVKCHGDPEGKLTVHVTGGTGNKRMKWTDPLEQTGATAYNLLADSYTVFVYDENDCQTTATGRITQPDGQLTINAPFYNIHNVSCFGAADGYVTFEISDGTPPYPNVSINTTPAQSTNLNPTALSADWTPTNLDKGTYIATAFDSNGCKAQTTVTILEPRKLIGYFSDDNVTHVSCFGGKDGIAKIMADGGMIPYKYSWSHTSVTTSNTVTDLAKGTYEVTITDDNNCTVKEAIDIKEPDAPLSAVIKAEDVDHIECYGASTGQAKATVSGGTPPYTIKWGDPLFQTGEVLRFVFAGDYTATITDAKNCPEIRTSTTITQRPELKASAEATAHNPCYGEKIGAAIAKAEGGTPPYRYLWNDPEAQTNSTATGLAADYWEVLVRDDNDCWKKAGVEIVEPNDPLNVQFKSYHVKHVLCYGEATGSAQPQVTGGTTPYKYSWNTSPNQTSLKASNLPGGSYTFKVIDDHNCEYEKNITIESPDFPITISIPDENISHNLCNGDGDGAIKADVSGGTKPYDFKWDDRYKRDNNIITHLSAGTYTLTVTDANECVETSPAVVVTQPDSLKFSVVKTDITTCFNEHIGSIEFINVEGGTAPYKHSIDRGTSFKDEHIFSNLKPSSNYTPMVKDANECKTKINPVIINAPAEIKITGVSQKNVLCNGEGNGEINITATGGTGTLRYSVNNGSTFQDGSGLFSNLSPGIYPIVVSDDNSCWYEGSIININEPEILTVDEITLDNGCNNANDGSIEIIAEGGVTPYEYSINGGTFQSDGKFRDLAPGSYVLEIRDYNSCSFTTVPQEITNPQSFAEFTMDITSGCSPLTVSFDNKYQGMELYWWSFGDNNGGISEEDPSHTYFDTEQGSKIMEVVAKVKTPTGCIDTARAEVEVLGGPYVEISANPYYQTYPDATIQINDFSTPGYNNYTWDMGDGTKSTYATQLKTQSHLYAYWGEYLVSLSVSNDICSASDTVKVLIRPPAAVPKFEIDQKQGCIPFSVNFTNNSEYVVKHQWDFGDGNTSTDLHPRHKYTEAGQYAITLTTTGYDDEVRTKTMYVEAKPLPVPDFAPSNKTVFLPEALVRYENLTEGGLHYSWDLGDGTKSIEASPLHQYKRKGEFTVKLIATSEFGCVDSIEKQSIVEVKSQPVLVFPNAFIPSASGPSGGHYEQGQSTMNTIFRPIHNSVKKYQLTIFNKWGNPVFETEDVNQGWDGYIGQTLAPMGVYIWRVSGIFENNQTFQDAGDLTLIR